MSLSSEPDAWSPLFAELVDDAGLFPPAKLPMSEALERHRRDREEGNPVVTGRFVCPSSRLSELASALDDGEEVTICLIVSPFEEGPVRTALEASAGDPRITIACLEGPQGAELIRSSVVQGIPCFVEIPASGDGLEEAADAGFNVKVRCGGLSAELFPSPFELAALLHRSARRGVAVKATAGLHHAVRHRDDVTGFVHHGFVNLLVAAAAAARGGTTEDVAAVLASEDADDLVRHIRSLTRDDVASARRLLASYGSCSTSDPVSDLQALELLPEPAAR